MKKKERKVAVVGAGSVGTTYVYALMHTGLANEIVLIDLDEKLVEGEVMDLSHGLPFIPPVSVKKGDNSDLCDAELIVITAGAKQKPGQSRMELINKNAEIVDSICGEIKKCETEAVIVMVTNPVDTLTQLALERLDLPAGRIIGSGTVLDTARLRYMLSSHCNVDARNVHAYVMGEHGDSEVTPWSMSRIGGMSINRYCEICGRCKPQESHKEIAERVRDSAYHIIDYKGSTFYGIGLSLVRISGAILRDEKSVLTVSTMLNGEYNIKDTCLSVPCIVGSEGVENIIAGQLTDDEQAALLKSAEKLHEIYENIKV